MSDLVTYWQQMDFKLNPFADDARPWVMPIVLRLERGWEVYHLDALAAAASGVAQLLTDARSAPEGPWNKALTSWMQGRIRKVTRRARASKWENLVVSETSGIVTRWGTAEIFVGVPHPVDQTPPLINQLQISGLDFPKTEDKGVFLPESEHTLTIAMNPDIPMTTGKAMAQAGHAAQLALLQLPHDDVLNWTNEYVPVVNVEQSASSFVSAPENCVEVHDAGFTEVEAGSLTVKAWF